MADTDTNPTNGGGGGEDIVVTDRQLFDSAISDPAPASEPAPSPSPEPPQAPPQTPQTPQEGGQRARDEQGRFVPQGQQPPPQQPRQQPPTGQPQAAQGQDHRVPLRELLEERDRRNRIQAENDQMRQQWQRLQYEQQQRELAYQQQQMPQTIYDNPDQYLVHNFVTPIMQRVQHERMADKDAMSREFANVQFGVEQVETALRAMAQVRHSPQGDFVFRQIMSSGHPYGALVNWFNYAKQQQEIGDPNAWKQKQQEAWRNDPKEQEEMARRWWARQQQNQPRGNGAQPNVQLPPSLSSFPASSGRAEQSGDMSDASLYNFATR